MTTNKTTISDNTAGRDIAAGNITTNNFFGGPGSALRDLAQRFQKECQDDEKLSEFIGTLQIFVARASTEKPSRDLEAKLIASGRGDLVVDAVALKERFFKKLVKLQYSEIAQQIFAHVLGKIHAFFMMEVKPLLQVGASRIEIDHLVHVSLLCPIYDEIGSSPLEVDLMDLQGMLYFLAGNCHIKWD